MEGHAIAEALEDDHPDGENQDDDPDESQDENALGEEEWHTELTDVLNAFPNFVSKPT